MQEERILHEAKLAKMEAEMKMVFQQKVQEKEAKLKQSEEELYARHREMKDALDKQRQDLEDKKRKIESGRPLTPEKATVSDVHALVKCRMNADMPHRIAKDEEGLPSRVKGCLSLSRTRKIFAYSLLPTPLLLSSLLFAPLCAALLSLSRSCSHIVHSICLCISV